MATIVPLSAPGGGGTRGDRRICLDHIDTEQIGDAKAEWVVALCAVKYVKTDNVCYAACPLEYNGRPCNKKLSEMDNMFTCERCQQTTQPNYRYVSVGGC